MASKGEIESVEKILNKYIPPDELKEVYRVFYGSTIGTLEISSGAKELADKNDFEIQGYKFTAKAEEFRSARIIRMAGIQHKIDLPTTASLQEQRQSLHKKIAKIIEAAHLCEVNVICMQEAWPMPFAVCSGDKYPWVEFAESAEHGPTTAFLQELSVRYNMVIISPIIERDEEHGEVLWNTVVVIDNHGRVLGKHRKNHIPRVGDFNESLYYIEGNTGHPVFQTEFGKIAINICYGRHHPQNWMMFGLNGAEIVFNPSATVGEMSEHLWGIEARNAAIANSYFTFAINRVGTEIYQLETKTKNEKPRQKEVGHYYGSSYVSSPDGIRTPGLSRVRDGLLITEVDLNACRQARDIWGFRMTQRIELYADSFKKASQLDFKPQIIQ